ncbi:phage tail tape measure protein [Nioella nitratireducens]|uniref:phage tail tape measure protein n=1 Tax=Nioella nitratireducens TaxID=1287720 RepID=UPI0008FD2536|nr:phage tail tape measure protein [Nioella nitratireducens]
MNEELDGLDAELVSLEATLGSATQMVAAFQGELRTMQDTMLYTGREVQGLSRSFGSGLRRAFDGVVFDGMRLSDALRTVAQSMVDAAYNTAMRPVQNALGGALAGGVNSLMSAVLPFETGGAFAGGRVTAFARGGVVSGPTPFAMRGGTGLMGEAGPEAIMPLTRGPDGKLGVQAQGGGRPVHVTMNITTPDVQGFQRSKSQVAAQMGRALARGQRNR